MSSDVDASYGTVKYSSGLVSKLRVVLLWILRPDDTMMTHQTIAMYVAMYVSLTTTSTTTFAVSVCSKHLSIKISRIKEKEREREKELMRKSESVEEQGFVQAIKNANTS